MAAAPSLKSMDDTRTSELRGTNSATSPTALTCHLLTAGTLAPQVAGVAVVAATQLQPFAVAHVSAAPVPSIQAESSAHCVSSPSSIVPWLLVPVQVASAVTVPSAPSAVYVHAAAGGVNTFSSSSLIAGHVPPSPRISTSLQNCAVWSSNKSSVKPVGEGVGISIVASPGTGIHVLPSELYSIVACVARLANVLRRTPPTEVGLPRSSWILHGGALEECQTVLSSPSNRFARQLEWS